MPKQTERTAGFAVSFYDQSLIEENARDRAEENAGVNNNFRRLATAHHLIDSDFEITETGWAQLNRDLHRLELNALAWLRKNFISVRDEGHDSHDDLIGSVWWSARSKKQRALLELGKDERIDMTDGSYGDLERTVWAGVSDFGQNVLGGQINFFDTGLDDE